MRSNLTVIARFAAEFEVEGGARHLAVHEVGIVAGVFYIGLAEPVPNAQSVILDRPSDTTLAVRKSGLISSSLPPFAALACRLSRLYSALSRGGIHALIWDVCEKGAELIGHLLNFRKQSAQCRKTMEQVLYFLIFDARACVFESLGE